MRNSVPLLQIHQLTRTFGGLTAVSALDLAVEQGEFVSVIGPNGAGKTTLFNLISGLDAPDAGRIMLMASRSPACRRRGLRRWASRAHSSTAVCSAT